MENEVARAVKDDADLDWRAKILARAKYLAFDTPDGNALIYN